MRESLVAKSRLTINKASKRLVSKLYFRNSYVIMLLVLLLPLLFGCSTTKREGGCIKSIVKKDLDKLPKRVYFTPVNFRELQGWNNDDHYAAIKSFINSCNLFLSRKNKYSNVSSNTDIGGKTIDWINVCQRAYEVKNQKSAKQFWEKWFIPYKVSDDASSIGKFTAYYEVELYGSKKPTKVYRYPVYRPPNNIKELRGNNIVSSNSINLGSLKNKGLEIAWVSDISRLYLMHIQGSGVINFGKGKEVRVGYACSNGFAFTSPIPCLTTQISSLNNKSKSANQTSIPNNGNQSYIFFRELNTGAKSPIGAQGVSLTSERSMAIDSRIFPYGTPFWIETEISRKGNKKQYKKLLIAQDRGGAIRGAVRADIFLGRGKIAEEYAISTHSQGIYYALFPKTVKIHHLWRSGS